jgi:hypothetical protein
MTSRRRAARHASLMLALLPLAAVAGDPPESVCELMATLAPDWLASHEAGKSVEEISAEITGAFDRAGLTADTDRGAIMRTAASISLIGLAQNDPQTAEAATEVALETCSTWYRSRGRNPYQIPDRPMLWE